MKRTTPLLLGLLVVGCGTDVAGPAPSLFSCAFGDAHALVPGEVLQVEGEGIRSLCLTAAEAGDYLYVPFFATAAPADDDPQPKLTVEITGAGFPSAQGTSADPSLNPWAARAPAVPFPPLRFDEAFHRRLREREIEELEPLIRPWVGPEPRAGLPGAVRTQAVPSVGDMLTFNVAISCSEEDLRTGRVEYVSEHAIVVADVTNPASLSASDYAYFGVTFDTLVYPVGTAHFGTPTDIDENGRSIIFFTRAVNELTPHDSETITAGFFWSGDLFPAEETERADACPAGNQAEMFYMLSPDPGGVFGIPLSPAQIRESSMSVIGHEYQHLINASRRLWVNGASVFERPWLNEGLSHISEELLFYAASGLGPGQNLTAADVRAAPNGEWAFERYMQGNFTNLRRYLARPDTASLMGIDNLSTRGAVWSFLRYAAGRSGRSDEAFFSDLVNSTVAGLDNLDGVLGGSGLGWMQDWTVSLYADDEVEGLDPRYALASWNLRDMFVRFLNVDPSAPGTYPLRSPRLAGDSTMTVRLRPGGAAYPVFTLDAGARAAIHVDADGDTPPATLRGSFLRIR